jgi:hypothetical protein
LSKDLYLIHRKFHLPPGILLGFSSSPLLMVSKNPMASRPIYDSNSNILCRIVQYSAHLAYISAEPCILNCKGTGTQNLKPVTINPSRIPLIPHAALHTAASASTHKQCLSFSHCLLYTLVLATYRLTQCPCRTVHYPCARCACACECPPMPHSLCLQPSACAECGQMYTAPTVRTGRRRAGPSLGAAPPLRHAPPPAAPARCRTRESTSLYTTSKYECCSSNSSCSTTILFEV